jgi:DNA-binding response OmpR family regulator
MRALSLVMHHSQVRVLVVEDNEVVADAIADGLRDQGMAVDVAYDGATGLENADLAPYDVVVLDRDLPVVHGDDVCTQLASGPSASRILMLTAAGAVANRVESLYLGADDYLGKPFDLPELAARVRALARRSPSTPRCCDGTTSSWTGPGAGCAAPAGWCR